MISYSFPGIETMCETMNVRILVIGGYDSKRDGMILWVYH